MIELSGPFVGGIGLGVVLLLLALRVPIGLALAAVSAAGIWYLLGDRAALSILGELPYEFGASWSFSSIPMFLLMGFISYHARLTEGLFRVARLWLSWLPGGLAISTVFGAAVFSAVSGSSLACAAAMGRTALPEMLKRGYDRSLSGGTVAAAGTLGTLIPPSITLIVYGIFVEVSIRDLFIAGVLPGIMVACLYAAMIATRVTLKPSLAPRVRETDSMRQRFVALADIWPVLLLILGVFGGLTIGIFTPTEAGAVGAFLSVLIALLRRTLTMRLFREAVVETVTVTAAIFLIAIGADLLTRFLVLTDLPHIVSSGLIEAGLSQLQLVLVMCLLFLVLGMFVEPIGIMLLTLPILLPTIEAANINLIWFGILVVKFAEIGLITPPVELNVFVVKGAAGDTVSLGEIFSGVTWFLVTDAIVVALLIAFPVIALFLPGLLT